MNIKAKIVALFTTSLITLSACQSDIQTSSGSSYGRAIPAGNSNVSNAASVDPLLKFPGKFCTVKMSEGYMSRMTGSEVATWETISTRHNDWGTITQISPMIINIVLSEGIGSTGYEQKATNQHVRLAAARQHCDAILAFEYARNGGSHAANAVLYDTRNGYTYITASQTGASPSKAFSNLSIELEQAMGQLAVQLR